MVTKLFLFLGSLSLCTAPLLCEQTHLVIEPGVLTEKSIKTTEEETLPEIATKQTKTNNPLLEYHKTTISCLLLAAALYGTSMYYYPTKTSLLALSPIFGWSLGTSIADYWYIFSHDNDYAHDMKSEARENLLYLSIVTGLCAGYYIRICKTGACV